MATSWRFTQRTPHLEEEVALTFFKSWGLRDSHRLWKKAVWIILLKCKSPQSRKGEELKQETETVLGRKPWGVSSSSHEKWDCCQLEMSSTMILIVLQTTKDTVSAISLGTCSNAALPFKGTFFLMSDLNMPSAVYGCCSLLYCLAPLRGVGFCHFL